MPLPAELTVGALTARFKRAKDRRNTSWWSHMKECYEHAAPQRETFDEHTPGEKKNTDIYDDTAVIGLQIFANRMQRAIVPPWQKWGNIVPGDDIPDPSVNVEWNGEQVPLADALDEITSIVFNYIHRSNFSSRIYESFIDLGISTGTIRPFSSRL